CSILLHPREPRIHGVVVEVVVADLQVAVEHDRDLVPPLLLQPRVPVHVNHVDVERVPALELPQPRDQLLAEVAILARKDRELGLQSPSGRKVMKRVPCSSLMSSATAFFGSSLATVSLKTFTLVMSTLFTRRITSPGPMPDASAAPSEASTITPLAIFSAFFW